MCNGVFCKYYDMKRSDWSIPRVQVGSNKVTKVTSWEISFCQPTYFLVLFQFPLVCTPVTRE